ncbi:MAG: hypothetical protein AAYR33_06850 [Acetobacteraceae bacterium]
MMGTTLGFLLASLMPDHADAFYMRARIYGESRIVCGAHWASDVEAGYRIAAQQIFLIMMRPEIKAQLPAVRKELEVLHAANGKTGRGAMRVGERGEHAFSQPLAIKSRAFLS